MGFSDISLFGSEIPTPNIDGIGREGMVFKQFYNCAKCVPTRGALMTGVQPHAVGADGTGGGLRKPCVTIPEVLKQAGYVTGLAGKWHLKGDPLKRGFDKGFFYSKLMIPDYWKPGDMVLEGEPYEQDPNDKDFHLTDALNNYAVDFIEKNAGSGRPFFFYLSHFAPHWVLRGWKDTDGLTGQAREEDVNLFRDVYTSGYEGVRKMRIEKQKQLRLMNLPVNIPALSGEEPAWSERAEADRRKTALQMANHAGLVHGMDRGIGRVLKAIKDKGIEKNTIVMFLSDNGADASSHGFGSGWASASCTPLSYYKLYLHEGGISTPFLAKWPGRIKSGRSTEAMGHVMDLMATCADVAGVSYPEVYRGKPMPPLQGKSLLPLFMGGNVSQHDHLCFEYKGKWAVRKGKWKAVSLPLAEGKKKHRRQKDVKLSEGSWKLYDIEVDRAEQTDLSEEHPDVLKDLKALLEYWWKNGYKHKPVH
jgi:arylsulfatase